MLTISRDKIEELYQDDILYWKLSLTCTSDTDFSPAIFIYHSTMGDDDYEGDIFEAVASIHQMQDIPEGDPVYSVEDRVIPFYRKNTCEVLVSSPREAYDLWEDIKEDIQELWSHHEAGVSFYA